MDRQRRRVLALMGAWTTLLATFDASAWAGIWNPCHKTMPQSLAHHPLVTSAWEGVDPQQFWDGHVHLIGNGDSGSGIDLSQEMTSPLHPMAFLQRLFYLNAGCLPIGSNRVDQGYLERMRQLLGEMPPGPKLLLFAFDRAYDESGRPLPHQSAFYIPNDYARATAMASPHSFEWVASIHPYRGDAVPALEKAHAQGAVAVKWLPPAMGIDPDSARCQPFYRAMAHLHMPLITHGGEEKAVHGMGRAEWGNPLRLRRALETGVRTIVAHCASMGEDADMENNNRTVPSFTLFRRMMANPAYQGLLFGDLSAVVLRNRDPKVLHLLLQTQEWHPRLLHGSDYPLPGILPLISPHALARAGLLAASSAAVLDRLQTYNPLLFDFILKRHLVSHGKTFSTCVFETRRFFERNPP